MKTMYMTQDGRIFKTATKLASHLGISAYAARLDIEDLTEEMDWTSYGAVFTDQDFRLLKYTEIDGKIITSDGLVRNKINLKPIDKVDAVTMWNLFIDEEIIKIYFENGDATDTHLGNLLSERTYYQFEQMSIEQNLSQTYLELDLVTDVLENHPSLKPLHKRCWEARQKGYSSRIIELREELTTIPEHYLLDSREVGVMGCKYKTFEAN